MKKLMIMGLMLISIPTFAQKMAAEDVPAAVKSSFSKTFPEVANAKWEKEQGSYEANFSEKNIKMSATFDESGKWMETERKINISQLPPAVAPYVANKYKGRNIQGAAMLKLPGNVTNYEAEIKGMDLIFDNNGTFIKAAKD